MKAAARKQLTALIAAANSLTGKRFSLLVASSLVATTAIIAAAANSGTDNGPLAALIGRSLAAERTPVAPEAAATPEAEFEPEASPAPVSSAAPEPLAAPEAAPAPEEEAGEEAEPTPTKPEETAPEPGPIQHVFVVSVASSGYDAAFGSAPQMPYLANTLRPQGLLLSEYKLLEQTALPNSIATISGQPPNPQTKEDCPIYSDFPAGAKANSRGIISAGGCIYPVESVTFSDQLIGARLKWHAYMESMVDAAGKPDSCVAPAEANSPNPTPVTGGYAAKLNPFVYFHSLLDLGDCNENDVPLSELEKDLKKIETTANFNYISPNLCSVGISGQCPAGTPDGAAAADAFLSTWVPKILASPAYKKDGLLIVNFGQVNTAAPVDPAAPPPATDPLKVGALVLSSTVAPGATDAVPYDPYSLLRTFGDLFNLSALGNAAGAKVKSLAPVLVASETAAGD
ncbi:MAG TPA: alkaline phosphatase family protein [Solirubrobacterales bacterium]|nr:alkaline phosphatase family protein [Solirubrobacterales bacterium]